MFLCLTAALKIQQIALFKHRPSITVTASQLDVSMLSIVNLFLDTARCSCRTFMNTFLHMWSRRVIAFRSCDSRVRTEQSRAEHNRRLPTMAKTEPAKAAKQTRGSGERWRGLSRSGGHKNKRMRLDCVESLGIKTRGRRWVGDRPLPSLRVERSACRSNHTVGL